MNDKRVTALVRQARELNWLMIRRRLETGDPYHSSWAGRMAHFIVNRDARKLKKRFSS